MKSISIINSDQLKKWNIIIRPSDHKESGWILARPLGMTGFIYRLRCAWLVFTGQCDVLKWKGGQ